MAELGHPVLGPQSFYKLTPGEIRIYAEGLQYQQEQQEQQTNQGQLGNSGPSYNKKTKQKRDEQALRKVEQRAQQYQQ